MINVRSELSPPVGVGVGGLLGLLALLLLSLVRPWPAQAGSSFPFLDPYPFTDVPLAAGINGDRPRIRQEDAALPAWKRVWDQAKGLAAQGELSQAAARYQAVLADKDIPEVRWELATVLVRLGRGQAAAETVEELLDGRPNSPEYLHCLAVIELERGRFREAAALFARLRARQPDISLPLAGQAYALLSQGDTRGALPVLSDLLRLNPADNQLREALARLAYGAQDYVLALPLLTELTKTPKPSPQLLKMAARAAEARQRPAEALGFWQRYAELRPDDLGAEQRLAEGFEAGGQPRLALPYLLALSQRQPDSPPIMRRLALAYAKVKDLPRAVAALEAYLRLQPDDSEAAKELVSLQEALGHKEETRRALKRYLAITPHPDQASLRQAASLDEEGGDHAGAAAALRGLLARRPGDPALMEELGEQLLAAGQNEAALKVWEDLARITPREASLWERIAGLLGRLGQERRRYQVLAVLHGLRPGDVDLSLQLLRYSLACDDLAQADKLAAELVALSPSPPPAFYSLSGELRLREHRFAAALGELEAYLAKEPRSEAVRLKAMLAAGQVGDLDRVRRHAAALAKSPENHLAAARAYAACRAEDEAQDFYQQVIGEAPAGSAVGKEAFIGLADSLARQDRPYEEEETLRLGLAVTGDRLAFVPPLFALALEQRETEEAGQWLDALYPLLVGPEMAGRRAAMKASLLVAEDEARKARRVMAPWEDKDAPGPPPPAAERLGLAREWLRAGKPDLAADEARRALAVAPGDLEALVILEAAGGKGRPGFDLSSLRPDQLRDLAELCRRYGLPKQMLKAARQAQRLSPPGAFTARKLLAQALIRKEDLPPAEAVLAALVADSPQEPSLALRLANLCFLRGELDRAYQLSNGQGVRSRSEAVLLRARILWRQNHWPEAIDLYQRVLTPSVAELLRQAGESQHVRLPEPQAPRPLWAMLARDAGPDPEEEWASRVMAPRRFLSWLQAGKTGFAQDIARRVALYRWQERFRLELLPRRSVARREYHIAQRQYEALLRRYPQDRILLYDLAGVYSRLGDLGNEALIYDQLAASGLDFPELNASRDRNQLKRKPRLTATYGYQNDAGHNGYLDRAKDWEELSFWEGGKARQEGELRVSRRNYRADSTDDVVRANRAEGSYSVSLLNNVTMHGGGGVESQETGGANTLLLNAGLTGKVGDGLTGALAFDQDVVDDTTASLRRRIHRQDLKGDLTLDPLPRLSLGGGYLFRDYSDNNWTTGYDLRSSYLLFDEPTLLKLTYSYDFKDSRQGGSPGLPLASDGFSANDHPYWAPKSYWLNLVGLYFKHSLTANALERAAPQYYTLEYALGHDANGYAVQSAKAGLYAELNPRYLLAAQGELTNSEDFRRQAYQVSLIYRW
ncbi:MAG: tetratricopeptide repeat protein [Desulfobacteraceae bacterium]|nr:tetratricopeptide repeat protein [Desulfobacteraceae bacterium]